MTERTFCNACIGFRHFYCCVTLNYTSTEHRHLLAYSSMLSIYFQCASTLLYNFVVYFRDSLRRNVPNVGSGHGRRRRPATSRALFESKSAAKSGNGFADPKFKNGTTHVAHAGPGFAGFVPTGAATWRGCCETITHASLPSGRKGTGTVRRMRAQSGAVARRRDTGPTGHFRNLRNSKVRVRVDDPNPEHVAQVVSVANRCAQSFISMKLPTQPLLSLLISFFIVIDNDDDIVRPGVTEHEPKTVFENIY